MTFGARLQAARKAAKKKQQDIADLFGISVQAVSSWERDLTQPEFSRILRLAEFLSVSVDDLLDGSDATGRMPVDHSTAYWAPLIDRVAAGQWKVIIAEGDRPRSAKSYDLGRRPVGEAFALEIESGSMAPEFREGDVIVIDTGIEPRPGDYVVAKLDCDDKATFKKYRLRGLGTDGRPVIDLVPLNDDYPTLTMSGDNPGCIVGVMIEHRRFRR